MCPSCLARRTADTAAWLVDSLLPEAGYRQWVLTFPYTMRFRLAADRHLLSTMLRVFLQVLFAWQRRRGRDLGIPDGRTGSVSFLQRFGSALNLNVHRHCILPDGLFVPVAEDPSAPLRFVPLPPPTTAEVEELTRTVADRLTARLAAASEEENDYLDPDLAALVEALFWSRNPPPGTRDIPRLPGLEAEVGRGRPAGQAALRFGGRLLAPRRAVCPGARPGGAGAAVPLRCAGSVLARNVSRAGPTERSCTSCAGPGRMRGAPPISSSTRSTFSGGWPRWCRSRTPTS